MPALHPLAPLVARQVAIFRAMFVRAIDGDMEPLHQARVATRRLRELLPLCDVETMTHATKRARARLQEVGRLLGRVRETDVARELLAELTKSGTIDAAVGDALDMFLIRERDARRSEMLDRIEHVNRHKLERDLVRVRGSLRKASDRWALKLAARMERRAERLRQAVEEAGSLYIMERVHAIRIAAKKLRYVLEIAADSGEMARGNAVRELKAVQSTLGRLHDVEVMSRMTQELVARDDMPAPGDVASWTAALADCRKTLERQCRELHGRYIEQRDALVHICDGASIQAIRMWTARGGELDIGRSAVAGAKTLKMMLLDERRRDGRRTASG